MQFCLFRKLFKLFHSYGLLLCLSEFFGWMDFQWRDRNLIKNPFVFQRWMKILQVWNDMMMSKWGLQYLCLVGTLNRSLWADELRTPSWSPCSTESFPAPSSATALWPGREQTLVRFCNGLTVRNTIMNMGEILHTFGWGSACRRACLSAAEAAQSSWTVCYTHNTASSSPAHVKLIQEPQENRLFKYYQDNIIGQM